MAGKISWFQSEPWLSNAACSNSQMARSSAKMWLVNHTMNGQNKSIKTGMDGRRIIINP